MRILIHNWRDQHHPEAGGAEKYIGVVAEGLAQLGHDVTFKTAAYPGALAEETVAGVRYTRRGGRYAIYPLALLGTLQERHYDVVIDVQNGVPYLSSLTRGRVVNLVHHVHREQWPVVFPPRAARVGWWVESRLAPAVYRRTDYVTVSPSTRSELADLGVDADRIQVIHNGTDAVADPDVARSPTPLVTVLGRLVPQKNVEIAIDAVAAIARDVPDIKLRVVGTGWWEPRLRDYVESRGLTDLVVFDGHVSEEEKHRILAESWVLALPSLKEGWGLVIVEAGVHGTPTVAFRHAGGPADAIVDGATGLLVDDVPGSFATALRRVIVDEPLRTRLSTEVSGWVKQYHWDETVNQWEGLLLKVARRRNWRRR